MLAITGNLMSQPLPQALASELAICRKTLTKQQADQNEFILQAQVGNTTRMEELIKESNVDIAARYTDFMGLLFSVRTHSDALYLACRSNQPGSIRVILAAARTQKVLDRIINARTIEFPAIMISRTPLHAAIDARCSKHTFDMLVNAGAEYNAPVRVGTTITPLHLLLCPEVERYSFRSSYSPVTEDGLAIALNILSHNTKDHIPIRKTLSIIPINGFVELVIGYFGYDCPDVINTQVQGISTNKGHTPLSLAALGHSKDNNSPDEMRRVELVRTMILSGGDVRIPVAENLFKSTPIALIPSPNPEINVTIKQASEDIERVEGSRNATSICVRVSNCFKGLKDFFLNWRSQQFCRTEPPYSIVDSPIEK